MHRRQALQVFAGLALCPLCTGAGFAADAHWSYEGATGPDKWGSLDAANSMCSTGTQQSPLDIGEPIDAQQPPLKFAWGKRPDTIVNNGHTIQLNFTPGDTLVVGNRTYGLVQFHFHHPSEHYVAGKRFAMEAHFVHADTAGGLAVVGVLMAAGRANAVFRTIVTTMPTSEGPPVKA